MEGREVRTINSDVELQQLLGEWIRRVWPDKSVGIIEPPFTLKPSKEDKLKILFHCRIMNAEGLLQYPLKYIA